MSRPTLYLAGLSSRAHHGPGRLLCAQAAPTGWMLAATVGVVDTAAPSLGALRLVQQTHDFAGYRLLCEDRWRYSLDGGRFRPGALLCDSDGDDYEGIGHCPAREVRDGDTIVCSCAAPGSPRRVHPCHLEILAPYLVRAGWDVVLWGRCVTLEVMDVASCCGCGVSDGYGGVECCGSPERDEIPVAVYADDGSPYDPAAYGWPR